MRGFGVEVKRPVIPISIELSDDEDRTEGLVFRYTATSLSRNGVTGRPSAHSSMRL